MMSSDGGDALAQRRRVAAVLHPVRIRILQQLSRGPATTAELTQALGDVPASSVYRNIAVLSRAGAIGVAEQRRVGGAIERTFRLASASDLEPDDAAHLDVADHRGPFVAFLTGLLTAFDRYEQASPAGTGSLGLGYVQVDTWLDEAERGDLLDELQRVLGAAMQRTEAAGRRPITLALVIMPAGPPP